MIAWSRLEEQILGDLRKAEEVRPPGTRLAQEWFWIAASRLQARGLCVADQEAGIVRRVE